jgi:hypothetical protein
MKLFLSTVGFFTGLQLGAQTGSFIKVPSTFSMTTKQWLLAQYNNAAKGGVVLYKESTISCGNNYGCLGSILPVTGLELTGQRLNAEKARLNWKTFSEINNKGFDLERKLGENGPFTFLVFVPGSIYSQTEKAYSLVDDNDFEGTSFYRVKQTDLDGRFVYSNIAAVKGFNHLIGIQPYPNPARAGNINFAVNGIKAGSFITVFIYDNMGRKIYENLQLQLNGSLAFTYKGPVTLAPGVYNISLLWQDKKTSANFVINK